MGKIIAVTNQKGGVGKTTTAVNLAAGLGMQGKKVLLVDMDPQGNATSGLGINKREIEISCYDVLILGKTVEEATFKTPFKNVSIVPSHISLAGAEIELVEMENRTMGLRASLLKVKPKYDFVIIDCPPSLGLITVNALAASDSILIPIQCEYYALEGLSQLISTVRTVKRMYNSDIEVEGVLLTMYDSRLNLTVQVVDEVKKYFADKIFTTVVPRNVRLSEAPSFGQPIMYFDKASKGAEAYLSLSKEIIKNNKKK
ncbi:MAG: AAA family ATPase [Angelakisella sp.]|nr:AAA family ATPase [Angelakisella sp.]